MSSTYGRIYEDKHPGAGFIAQIESGVVCEGIVDLFFILNQQLYINVILIVWCIVHYSTWYCSFFKCVNAKKIASRTQCDHIFSTKKDQKELMT